MKKIQHNHTVSGVFVFLLLGIFAVSATVMVLVGAQAYNGTAKRSTDHNGERLSSAYVRGRLREADENGSLSTAADDSSLKIYNDEDGTATVLYVYDGMLYEWYTLKSLAQKFDPSENMLRSEMAQADNAVNHPEGSSLVVVQTAMGESVCPLDEMRIRVEGNLLKVDLRNGEEWTEVDYCIRTVPEDQR